MTATATDLDRYLQILAGANPTGRLIEIRSATPHGAMRQTFTPATRTDLAAQTITKLATRTDVYIGVLLRHRRAGGRHACERSHLAFVEIDRPDALQRLDRYRCPPSIVISSGGTPGHAHAYWQLHQPVEHDELEDANRRLAIRLGGDLASIDAARILRPPTSMNWKRTPPTPVQLLVLEPDRRYQLAELTAGLDGPSPRPRSTASPQPRRDHRTRPTAPRDPRRHLPTSTHRPTAQPRRQNPLPAPRRPQPQPPALRPQLVLLRLPHRRHHLRPRRPPLRPRNQRPRIPPTPPTPRRRAAHHSGDQAPRQTGQSLTHRLGEPLQAALAHRAVPTARPAPVGTVDSASAGAAAAA